MRKTAITVMAAALMLSAAPMAKSQVFETATEAVHNMGIGWNLGNTLEANANDTTNMWIELWTAHRPSDYESAWGQAPATRELMHLMKESGFNAIRVPVTWYPHMGVQVVQEGNKAVWHKSQWEPTPVDSVWMARVEEVVNYVLDEGMYCILNVHHDTGAESAAWLHASGAGFAAAEATYRSLWEQIATRFRDYDEHLIFEAYNEMLDDYDSWCFASFAAPGNYNAASAADTYQAINNYAAAFVQTVRQTGGNNSQRNLMVNTYGACSGHGTWSTHLQEPLTQLQLPEDGDMQHLMVSVHSYPSLKNNDTYISKTSMQNQNSQQIQVLQQHLQQAKNVPVVIGEWASSNLDNDYTANRSLYLDFVKDFTARCLAAGICPMYWMGISDGKTARTTPSISQPDILQQMMNAASVEQTELPASSSRIIFDDGRLLIHRAGATYTLTGVRIQ